MINVALSFKNPLMYSVKWKSKNVPEVRECHDSPGLRALEMLEPNISIWQRESQEAEWL